MPEKCFHWQRLDLCEGLGNKWQIAGSIGSPSIGYWGEIGGVGFEQNVFNGCGLDDRPDIIGIAKSRDAVEPQ